MRTATRQQLCTLLQQARLSVTVATVVTVIIQRLSGTTAAHRALLSMAGAPPSGPPGRMRQRMTF